MEVATGVALQDDGKILICADMPNRKGALFALLRLIIPGTCVIAKASLFDGGVFQYMGGPGDRLIRPFREQAGANLRELAGQQWGRPEQRNFSVV